MKKKFNDLQLGDYVADMHGKSFKWNVNWQIEEPVHVVRHIELRGHGWGMFIEYMCATKGVFIAHNKHCYVIGECSDGIVVAYNYDARQGGIAVLEVVKPKKPDAWECKCSPDGYCHYFTCDAAGQMIELYDGRLVPVPDPEHDRNYETEDDCLFCHQPDERK